MGDETGLLERADRNFVEAFARLASHQDGGAVERFGSVVGVDTRVPARTFNGAIVLEEADPGPT